MIFSRNTETIKGGSFRDCKDLEEINLPENLITIEDEAFENCEGLKKIEIPESVTTVKNNAFRGCTNVGKIVIHGNITNGANIFTDVGTTAKDETGEALGLEAEFTEGVTVIGGNMFGRSVVKKIKFPSTLKEIGSSAFSECMNLEQIDLPESLEIVRQQAFNGCQKVSYLKINSDSCTYETSTYNSTRPAEVFGSFGRSEEIQEKGLTVEFGDTVKTIKGRNMGFKNTNLKNVIISSSVEKIDSYSFGNCNNLTTVTLPSKLKDIAGNAFANCKNLKEYIVSDENKDLSAKDGVLYGKDETELISYPAGKEDQTEFDMLSMNVDTIREGAFDGNTALKAIKIGDDVQTIGEEAFANVSDSLKLYVYKNSYADEYAKENEVPVEYLSEQNEEGTPVFRGASLSLAGTILINYYIELPENVKDGGVDFDLVDDSGKTKSKVTATLQDASKETITSGGKQYNCYLFSVSLTAKQMTDKVLAKAYATTEDGKEGATRKFYYSVEKYVSNKMKNTATKDSLKNVLASMVSYGAASQNYFGYNTQHLADRLLSDTNIVTEENKKKLDDTLAGYQKTKEQMQQYTRTITEIDNPKTKIAGIALDLKSAVSIRAIIPKSTASLDDKLAYTVGDGTVVKYLKLQNYDATYYYADITGIVAKNLDEMYHIYVCDASGNQISNIVNYGVMSYAAQKWESENETLVNLVKKLQIYNIAAQKYFESK